MGLMDRPTYSHILRVALLLKKYINCRKKGKSVCVKSLFSQPISVFALKKNAKIEIINLWAFRTNFRLGFKEVIYFNVTI